MIETERLILRAFRDDDRAPMAGEHLLRRHVVFVATNPRLEPPGAGGPREFAARSRIG